jgi:hypothetical protein
MQVLIRKSDIKQDVQCSICGQGFRLYWERTSVSEQEATLDTVHDSLRRDHASDLTSAAHSDAPYTVPRWEGAPQFSGAALLGGLSGIHRAFTTESEATAQNK